MRYIVIEEEDGGDSRMDSDSAEEGPLDLTCPSRKRVRERSESPNSHEDYSDDSDAGGDPARNPKAYKKSLMKRYRKFLFCSAYVSPEFCPRPSKCHEISDSLIFAVDDLVPRDTFQDDLL